MQRPHACGILRQRYDTILYTDVRSKADKMASLVMRTAQEEKNKENYKQKPIS